MMDRDNYAIITFPNSHLVLKGEKALEKEDVKIIPLPSQISAGCGLCVMCDTDNIFNMTKILDDKNILYRKLYKVTKVGLDKKITEIDKE